MWVLRGNDLSSQQERADLYAPTACKSTVSKPTVDSPGQHEPLASRDWLQLSFDCFFRQTFRAMQCAVVKLC